MDYTLILDGSSNDDDFSTHKCFLRIDQELLRLAKEGIDFLKSNPKTEFVLYGVEAKDVFFADDVPDEISGASDYVDQDMITSKFDWKQYHDIDRVASAPSPCSRCCGGPSADKCETCENREAEMDIDEAIMALDQIYKNPVELVEMHVQISRVTINKGAFEIYFRSNDADEDEPNSSDYWADRWLSIEEIENAIKLLDGGQSFVLLETSELPF